MSQEGLPSKRLIAICLWTLAWLEGGAGPCATPQAIDMQGKDCLTAGCHASLRDQKFVHGPVAQGDCGVCHPFAAATDATTTGQKIHQFRTAPPNLELCSRCHKQLTVQQKDVHAPFTGLCTQCHNPHGGKARFFIVGDSVGDLCLKCHGQIVQNRTFIHAPVALKACPSCHAAHTSDYPALLTRPPEKLCVFCHVSFGQAMAQAVSVHPPVRQACYGCHDPHGGMARAFLPADQAQLCVRCHAATVARMNNSTYPHRAMIEGKKCSDCHDPHWSSSTALLKRPSMQICLQCHSTLVHTKDGRDLAAVGEQISEDKYVHGPIRQQDCTPCHAVHGSEEPRLMKAAFPVDFYAPFTEAAYALCFGCHNPDIVNKKRTAATGFRDGETNLHYLHVHQQKGRSCRACHAVHASNNPFHIRDWVAFGQWKLMIQYQKTDNGGTCLAGCHVPRSYDRVKPVNGPINMDLGLEGVR